MTATTINSQIAGWTEITWEEYLKLVNSSDLDKTKFYYREGKYIVEMSLLAEALQRTRKTNHAMVGAWLMQQFSN